MTITKEVNSVPYRPVWSVYTIPASNPVQITPCFVPEKIPAVLAAYRLYWLYLPVNGYRAETQTVSFVRKENREEGEKKEDDDEVGLQGWHREATASFSSASSSFSSSSSSSSSSFPFFFFFSVDLSVSLFFLLNLFFFFFSVGLSISLSFFFFLLLLCRSVRLPLFLFLLNFVMYGLVSHFLFLCFVFVFEVS